MLYLPYASFSSLEKIIGVVDGVVVLFKLHQ